MTIGRDNDHHLTGTARRKLCSRLALRRVGALLLTASMMAACTPGAPVTGRDDSDPTIRGSQAETASISALAGEYPILVVTYNDDTADSKVQYTQTDRTVFPGASLLGWSFSNNGGATWKYGGKVRPPPGIAALWGDPAIVTAKYSPNLVYISALAADTQIVPPSGRHGGMATSGACIARSTDGGIHFAIFQCFGADRDFYDGATMAAAGGPQDHRIFAAYTDITHNRIDVWQSADGTGPFQRIADPFPGKSITGHPRLAYDDSTGALLVAAIAFNPAAGDSRIYMNRLVGNQWQQPRLASQPITGIVIPVGNQRLRMASGFSFDVGSPSYRQFDNRRFANVGALAFFQDAIRLLYTTRDSTTLRLYVRGTGCARDLSVCNDEPQWGTTPGNFDTRGHQWNPTVKASPSIVGYPAVWKATYQTTDDRSDRVSIKQGTLTRTPTGAAVFQPVPLMTPRIVCPDLRTGSGGYWGDYDEAAHVGRGNGGVPLFLLAFTDSSRGCVSQKTFSSSHVHVRAVKFQ